jgi:hypothetical protein
MPVNPQAVGSGAATGALVGSAVPGVGTGIGALVGGGLGLASGFMGGQAAGQTAHDIREAQKRNIAFQQAENAKNRAFAEHLLDISHPQMSGADLGNLLFSQGEHEAKRTTDNALAMALRQNLRSGAPMSATDLIGGVTRAQAGQWADRASQSRLQGIMGVLPGAAAIQTAGGVSKGIAPQLNLDATNLSSQLGNNALPNTLASIQPSLAAMLQAFGGSFGTRGTNPTLGNENYQATGSTGAAY